MQSEQHSTLGVVGMSIGTNAWTERCGALCVCGWGGGEVMAGGRGGPCRLSRRAWMKQVIVIGFPLGLASRDFNSLGGLFLIWRRYKVRAGAERGG